jgi:hypothetical protein
MNFIIPRKSFENQEQVTSVCVNIMQLCVQICTRSYGRELWKKHVFISTETTRDIECAITPLDRPSWQLQNTIVSHSHQHWLCISASDEQEPACYASKTCATVEATHFLTAAMTSSLSGKCCLRSPSIMVPNRGESEGAKIQTIRWVS